MHALHCIPIANMARPIPIGKFSFNLYLFGKPLLVQVKDQSSKKGIYRNILVDCLKIDKTMEAYESHTRFIEKVFLKFRRCFQNMTKEQMKKQKRFKGERGKKTSVATRAQI